MITLLKISIGIPDLEAKVAAWRRKSWGRKWIPTILPALAAIIRAVFKGNRKNPVLAGLAAFAGVFPMYPFVVTLSGKVC